jgi:hypothetical protein
MERTQRWALRNPVIGLSLLAGLLCLVIALAQAYAAASSPPRPASAIQWPLEPVLPAVSPPVLTGWQPVDGEAADDEPVNAASAPAPDAYDGLYAGSAPARDGGQVTYRVTVKGGVGTGTQSRLDCGTAPLSLRISSLGDVSGKASVFGPTCLKTDVALRGRAVAGLLQLRLGTQYLELAKQ